MSIQSEKADAVGAIMAHLSNHSAYLPVSATYTNVRNSLLKKLSLEDLDKMYLMCLARSKYRHPVFMATARSVEQGVLQLGQPSIFTKYFYSIHKAKLYCEKHYGDPINWMSSAIDQSTSGRLGRTMYDIQKVRVEVI